MKLFNNHILVKIRLIGFYILFAFVLAMAFQSCDEDSEISNKPTLYIVTEDVRALTTYGGTIPIEFLCNLDWEISTENSWITLSNVKGNLSSTVEATIAKNEEGTDRIGVITIKAGELEKELKIEQKYRSTSPSELEIKSQTSMRVPYEGGEKVVDFSCNVNWEISTDVDWIILPEQTTGREDATFKIVISKNEGEENREGIITITAEGGVSESIKISQLTKAMAGMNLLDTEEEDYSFERITTNKYWPALGEWGGSNAVGIGKFGANSTAIRVAASAIPRTGQSYLFLRMRNGETAESLDWLWRKFKDLIPGQEYTFSFWYKTPANTSAFMQTGNIRLGAVVNEADIATLNNPLSEEVTFGYIADGEGEAGSANEHKKVSYTFTMPEGKTEVYIVWHRNGNQQPYLDDFSLVMNP